MAKLLKDLYDEKYIDLLCSKILNHFSKFTTDKFKSDIFNEDWWDKELKARMRHISCTLRNYLPDNYGEAIRILKSTFNDINFSHSLENMVFQDFVEVYGLNDLEMSLNALESFTINSSSEFAIRKFILKYPIQTIQQLLLWANSHNEHVRRLASEGSRPHLPWAIALPPFKSNPSQIIDILTLLKDDESPYVRKSVANNLNDISKDNPQLVRELCFKWINHSKNRDALLKHACRTLLKASDAYTLNMFGYLKPSNVKLKNFIVNKKIEMGKEFSFEFDLYSPINLGKLRIEFAIYFLRKNGSQNKKVFKISEGTYHKKQKKFHKIYSFKPISTRTYYKGSHKLSILVNGVVFKEVEFTLF